jgi:hypothetical protein
MTIPLTEYTRLLGVYLTPPLGTDRYSGRDPVRQRGLETA